MPVACQSRDLARPQARIPVRVTKKDSLYLQRIQGFSFIYQWNFAYTRHKILRNNTQIFITWQNSVRQKAK